VFHIPQQSYYAYVSKNNFFESTTLEPGLFKRYVEPTQVVNCTRFISSLEGVEQDGNRLYQIGDLTIAHLTHSVDSISSEIDLIILSRNVAIPFQKTTQCKIVIDQTCKSWYKKKILSEFPQAWAIADRGAFILEMQ
jgi:hypothetical protein